MYKQSNILYLNEEELNINIHITGRIHKIRRAGGLCFLILRYQTKTIQCISKKNQLGKDKFTELSVVPTESIVQLYGQLNKLPAEINQVDSTYYKNMEFVISDFKIVSLSQVLPFSVIDADSSKEESDDFRSTVLIDTRLDNRWIDLRVPTNNCIFKLRSGIVQAFRNFLLKNNFTEIQTPKLLGTASESGSAVFKLKYFEKDACLAQSPQLYKQMAICADFDRVFEIGPVFRAENSVSYRHLCEFTGLDLEMTLEPNEQGEYDYKQTTTLIWNLLKHIQTYLYSTLKEEIEYIRNRTNFIDLIIPNEPLYVDYQQAVDILNAHYAEQPIEFKKMEYTDDLTTAAEKILGNLIKKNTGSDMFILTGYPSNIRPFYTMLNHNDPKFSNSYDIILNGTEISSGAQRVHQYDKLLERVVESGINPTSLYGYLDAFKYGCKPHAGCGLGLERLVILFFGLKNVRQASFCPRDPNRLLP